MDVLNICLLSKPENASSDKPKNAIFGFAQYFINKLAEDRVDSKLIKLASY